MKHISADNNHLVMLITKLIKYVSQSSQVLNTWWMCNVAQPSTVSRHIEHGLNYNCSWWRFYKYHYLHWKLNLNISLTPQYDSIPFDFPLPCWFLFFTGAVGCTIKLRVGGSISSNNFPNSFNGFVLMIPT